MKPYIRPAARIKKQILLLIVAFSIIIPGGGYYYPKIEKNSILQNDYSKLKVIANLKENQIETRMNIGKDFRSMKVLVDASIIPSTKRVTAAKIDNRGGYLVLSSIGFEIGGISILLIVIAGLGLSRYYNKRQRNTFKELYNKEKELWQNQERFEITMDSLGEGVITLGLDGKVHYMNTAAKNLTGWKSTEARGRDLHDIYPVINEETGKRENNILDKVLKHGVVKELANHTLLISKDGKKIPVMDTGAPIFDRDGKITGVVIAFQDETEKRTQGKLLKESENRLRSTLDNMLEGCQIIGFDYRYLYLNQTALQQSKSTNEKLLGRTMMECYPGIENTEMFSKLKLCMGKRISEKMENKFKYPDGTNGWFNLSFEPVPEGVFILSEDITAQKKAEEVIRVSEEKYRKLFENNPQPMWMYEIESLKILEVNQAAIDHYGYSRDEFLSKTLKDIRPEEDIPLLLDDIKSTNMEYNKAGEWRHVKKNGEIIFVEIVSHTVSFNGRDARHVLINDITERKKTEEEIKKLSRAVEQSPVSVLITDPNGNIDYVNDRFCEMTGYSRSEVMDKNPRILKSGYQDKNFYKELWDTILSGKEWRGELQNKMKNGTLYWESVLISPLVNNRGEVTNFIAVQEDITERKRYQESLKLFRTLIDQSNDAIELIDPETGQVIDCNEKAFKELGYTREEFLSLKVSNYDINFNEAKFAEIIEVLRSKGGLLFESRHMRKDGYEFPVEVNVKYIKLNREYVLAIARDITERKKTEEEIKHSEEKYRNLVDNALIGVYESNLDGKFSFGNKVLLETLGISSIEALKDTKIMEIYTKSSDRGKFINALKENGYVTNYEIDFNIKGKEIIHTLISARLKGNKITGMIMNITEKKNAENAMIEAKEKAEEMNRLKNNFLANMSHELRTPMIGILGYAEFLEQEIKDENLTGMVKVIRNSANRLNKTLNNILDISKIESEQQQIDLEEHNLLASLSEQVKLFKLAADKKGITLNIDTKEKEVYAKVDIGLFESIIDNLLNNAIKYTNKGYINLNVKQKDGGAVIEIKDTGIGIPENAQGRIFEPFRQASEGLSRKYEGTGLGLTLVKKYIDLMGGTISLESKEGAGSLFTLMFPLIDKIKV